MFVGRVIGLSCFGLDCSNIQKHMRSLLSPNVSMSANCSLDDPEVLQSDTRNSISPGTAPHVILWSKHVWHAIWQDKVALALAAIDLFPPSQQGAFIHFQRLRSLRRGVESCCKNTLVLSSVGYKKNSSI